LEQVASLFPDQSELAEILVGPESVSWRVTSDTRLYFPWDRLLRTIDYVCLLVYGGAEAHAAGHRLRELHRRFKGVTPDGRRYSPLEPDAYAWVAIANGPLGTPC
jgi:uncharacterized protein (DUF2236 family)